MRKGTPCVGVLLEDLWEGNKEARFEVLSGREEWGSEATWNLQSCVIVQVGPSPGYFYRTHVCTAGFFPFFLFKLFFMFYLIDLFKKDIFYFFITLLIEEGFQEAFSVA